MLLFAEIVLGTVTCTLKTFMNLEKIVQENLIKTFAMEIVNMTKSMEYVNPKQMKVSLFLDITISDKPGIEIWAFWKWNL